VGCPWAREIFERSLAKQVEKVNATPMNINESDVEPARLGKPPRLTSPSPSLMHSGYDAALAMVKRREDDRGENDTGGSPQQARNPTKQNTKVRFRGSRYRVTEPRITIMWGRRIMIGVEDDPEGGEDHKRGGSR